ncbi:hypothetical protein BH24ACT21_BH24ACT21_05210 [soil metagenome]
MRKMLGEPPASRGRSPGGGISVEGLWVRFFGDFEVFYRGEAVDLGRNSKAIAIFRRLLANHPQPVSQEVTMEWLWPESGPQKARWSLNSAIYALRGVLGALSEDLSGGVALEGGRYHISSGLQVSSDVQEFGVHYERGRLFERSGEIEEAVLEYEEAVGFYRDDYLTEDLYEDWTMIERERLTGGYVNMLDRLSDYYVDDGQLQKSIGVCYQILEKDPYHEESYRRLMRCYSRLGLRSRAAQQYELCRRMLGRLYGTAPVEETQDLHRRVLRGEAI